MDAEPPVARACYVMSVDGVLSTPAELASSRSQPMCGGANQRGGTPGVKYPRWKD